MSSACVLVFARKSDIPLAVLAARSIPPSWRRILVLEPRDANESHPWSEEVWVRDFNRGGNLNGYAACLGIAEAFADASQSVEKVMKLDADSLILDPSYFLQEGLCGFTQRTTFAAAYGFAYSIPSNVALKLPQTLKAWSSLGGYFGPEDVTLSNASLVCGAKDNRLPLSKAYVEAYNGGKPDGKVAGHYRNINVAKQAGLKTNDELLRAVHDTMTRDLQSLSVGLT